MPSFRLGDNSVHLHECSPLCVGISKKFKQGKLPCLLFYVDMRILIGKALKHFYITHRNTYHQGS